ncbi:penicillin-binding protein 1C [Solimonas sp. K1W22B-7]|uniref:transglycosylase domain-containing protein n=1 Tax=Solimonas sp. K1W22B-7 TaxID=2303331 RepID=UPI000E331E88|nr:transglycosylase domain-containing protein [Solimonas sp. K1W22B-7]AXQ29106.1 penicillin-binding protein 1C [Solimonas sp. K1W22B-7]
MKANPAKLAAGLLAVLALATLLAQRPLPRTLQPQPGQAAQALVLDRQGRPLNLRYDGGWNLQERVPLEQVPPLLRQAFVEAEDRRYWAHHGVDWRARFSATWTNLRAGRSLRGASTITEQALRVLNPRPRTLWSRWVEGFEALRLDARFSKPDILEFYLNQVPYGANRRGVAPAAHYYFGRSLETLSEREMLALAVLVRAPSRLVRQPEALDAAIARLAQRLAEQGALAPERLAALQAQHLSWAKQPPELAAAHFAAEAQRRYAGTPPLRSSLDAALQASAEGFLRQRLEGLRSQGVRQGALLAVDLDGNRVRAYASVDDEHPGVVGVDAVQALRQPGSTLKPLLYAMAIEKGWNADTVLEDTRLTERVNAGLHEYRNYSRMHYGRVSLREALGNSLNIPALKALQFVGGEAFLQRLRALGMEGLSRHPDFYGDGIALGNGEVSLFQLVQAYAALTRGGQWQALSLLENDPAPRPLRPLIQPAAARAISEIISDPQARLLEFGDGGLLRFPAETAVKTGTSSDYRDAWTVAYNGRYLVGVWMGNLSGRETDGITGAQGPALLTRSLLARLEADRPLQRSQRLAHAAGALPAEPAVTTAPPAEPRLSQPFDGLMLAMDPRIPDRLEAFEFVAEWNRPLRRTTWHVNGASPVTVEGGRYLWPLARGRQRVWAELETEDGQRGRTPETAFLVK